MKETEKRLIMLNIALFVCNSYEENTMVINRKDSHDAIIIDPGCTEGEELDRVVSYIEKNGLKPAAILLTHAHPDHTAGVAALQGKYGIPVYMHPLERPKDSFRSTDIEAGTHPRRRVLSGQRRQGPVFRRHAVRRDDWQDRLGRGRL